MIKLTQISETEYSLEQTYTETATVKLEDCSFNLYHSDSNTPEDRQGWYCRVSSNAGTFDFKVDFGADQEQFINDLKALFNLYITKL